jgi:beta-glucosidase
MKHFALNSQETNRTENSAEVDERTMREITCAVLKSPCARGTPTSVMCAYNKINSIWCSENRCLLTEILKGDLGYDGLVVSDWGAVHDEAKALPPAWTCACQTTPTSPS